MINRMRLYPLGKTHGFTLVEMLVTTASVVALASVALAVSRSTLSRAQQTNCMGNLKNIGAALHMYAADHNGKFPETTHTTDFDEAWIVKLEAYLGDFDSVRICPADPRKNERLKAGGTSYILNSYIFVPEIDPFGEPIGTALNRLSAIPQPERTIVAFICSDRTSPGPGNDHTHSNQWSSWSAVCSDIAPDRFGGGSKERTKGRSNYLYVDGSVLSLEAGEIKRITEAGINIAKPPGIEDLP